ncbi:MAG: thiamine biosynthesis protein ThiJ [Solirubrobacterales bacterium]|nr:thiamine biosynthesis protein ThiJ [Solirubrobacterales bacterium]
MSTMLIVLTGADTWTLNDETRHPTGFWAEELLAPMRVFREAGVEMTISTPGGVRPTVDEGSMNPDVVGGEDNAAALRAELEVIADVLAAPLALEDVAPDDYDGVFIPGGHGPMEDLAVSEELGRLLVTMLDGGQIIASVCHGPAALLSATRDDGTWAFAGREISAFTNEEETQAGLADKAPWLLEDRLGEATVRTGPAWQPFSIADGDLVTGQNPASSTEVAEKAVERLDARSHRLHVVPHEGGWTFKHEHGEPEGHFATKKEAVQATKAHGRQHGDWEVVIHDRHGVIRDSVTIDRAHESRKRDRVH